MIARVAVVPQPPLLVPELVAGVDPDAARVRAECLAAVTRLADAARRWVAVAVDPAVVDGPTVVGPHAAGTFRGYGVDVRVRLAARAAADPDPALPLPALIAGWLRGAAGADEVRVWMVRPDLPAADCRGLGERLVAGLDTDEPVGLLVIGDGSHRHGDRAVGRPDERASGFDERVSRALAAADPAALLDLDPGLAETLGAVGRAAWQILSGVVAKDGRIWQCTHSRLMIPFGVAYHVAVWDPR
ncbi:MAG TPA: hypothetical protein VFV67_06645 [Actinophytocola sp.]|uniref:hypothetical protein n=1 Tax=Actinophytocola sp. TaxID=1872138 RepID=UPI002DBEA977|nr:hypothetical protein [Actinophytocola sp.]HEU5470313.1 hypothetical protein [Actinophytocola sp.]